MPKLKQQSTRSCRPEFFHSADLILRYVASFIYSLGESSVRRASYHSSIASV